LSYITENKIKDVVIATVDVGSLPWEVVVTPDGRNVYVTNEVSNNGSVIDTINNTVTATVPVGSYPLGIVVNPVRTDVYVAN
jgi:YVTN family beta-propeller protein